MSANDPIRLLARDVRVSFRGLTAIDGVTLELHSGEILGLIGPNGAGKSTLLNVISGYQPPDDGKILLGDRDISGLSANRRARLGVARTFQGVRVFPSLTVTENIECGAIGAGLSRRSRRAAVARILHDFDLAAVAELPASALPYGDERRLSLARSLASEPRFLLLDEPAAGLDEQESRELGRTIGAVRDQRGCGVLLIEHDMPLVMSRCERVHVIARGKTIALGSPEEVRRRDVVAAAYLGAGSTTVGA